MAVARIAVGEQVPWFVARSPVNPNFQFSSAGGRYCVLSFVGSLADPFSQQFYQGILAQENELIARNACFFGVTIDPSDETAGRAQAKQPCIHWFYDFDLAVSRLCGAVTDAPATSTDQTTSKRFTVITDERLRTYAVLRFGGDPAQHVAQVMQVLRTLPVIDPPSEARSTAPILIVPRIFEPDFCRLLIQHYNEQGGVESGFMRDIDGKTVMVFDHVHKRRRDQLISDESLLRGCADRLASRLVPEIKNAFQFNATHIERYVIGCYEAETGGYFRAHRDNTTLGTAHRRFAVSLVLNAEEFSGGALRFPEFGQQTYHPPTGGAVVFSCSLLHEATPLTQGKRYVFLPFLYDEAAARIRAENQKFLAQGAGQSRK